MEKKELNKLLNMIAKYKYFTDEKRDKIFSYLEEYKEKEPFYYHKNIGRICALFGPLDMAITHLNTAKELDETNPSVYYELYKCHIKNNDFESALDNLTACIKADGGVHNFELPIMMLRSLVDMDLDSNNNLDNTYYVGYDNKFAFKEIDNPKLLAIYYDMIREFNKKKYDKLLNKLGKFKFYAESIEFPIDVDALIEITKELILKGKSKSSEVFNDDILDCMNIEEYISFIKSGLVTGELPYSKIFVHLERMAKNDPNRCEMFIKAISSLKEFENKELEFKYLKGIIDETKKLNALDIETRTKYSQLMVEAKTLFLYKNLEQALMAYEEALAISGLNVCNYYIAKTIFKIGNVLSAKKRFEEYIETGGEKMDKALLYLIGICGIKKWDNTKYERDMLRIHESFERDFKYVSRNSLEQEFKQFDEKNHQGDKAIKAKEKKSTKDSDNVEDYYECTIDGKLKIIRNLFRNGNSTLANQLLEELNRTCEKKDKEKVLQMIRNKKIFVNQNRC